MIHKTIIDYLQAEYDSGMTQAEMAQKHKIAQSQINRILAGDKNACGFSIQTLDKMFPNAEIFLEGQNNISGSHIEGENFNAGGCKNSIVTNNNYGNTSQLASKFLNSEKFSAEEKIKILQFLEEVK